MLSSQGCFQFLHSVRNFSYMQQHLGVTEKDKIKMLRDLRQDDMQSFIEKVVPEQYLLKKPLNLPPAINEYEVTHRLRELAERNNYQTRSLLGQG